MLDGKKMGLDKSMKKIPVADIMEEARSKLASALKMGAPFIVAMTKSCTDFALTFTDAVAKVGHGLGEGSYIPIEMFEEGGKKLLADSFLEALIRPQERADTSGFAVCRDPAGFYVALTTQFSPEDFEEYLFGNDWGLPKPKDKYFAIIIAPPPPPAAAPPSSIV